MDKKRQAELLLLEKYQEPFSVYRYGRGHGLTAEDAYTVICHPIRQPEMKFKAEIEYDGGYMLDEYISRRVCVQMEEQLTDRLKQKEKGFILRVGTGTRYVASHSAKTDMEEFISQNPQARFIIYIIFDERISARLKKLYPELVYMLKGLPAINGGIELYFARDTQLPQIQRYMQEHAWMDTGFDRLLKGTKKIFLPIRKGQLHI